MKKFLTILLIIFFSSSCVEMTLLGSMQAARISVKEKTLANSRKDLTLTIKLIRSLAINNLKMPANMIDVTINEGRVLLTGVVEKEINARKAVNLAWQIQGVKEVIDEIQIVKNFRIFRTSKQYVKDTAITGNIEAQILLHKNIHSVNYAVTTVNNVVYLLGVAQSNSEIYRITNIAAKVKNVSKVVSHIILKNDSRRSK